jgi:hypothetical protein
VSAAAKSGTTAAEFTLGIPMTLEEVRDTALANAIAAAMPKEATAMLKHFACLDRCELLRDAADAGWLLDLGTVRRAWMEQECEWATTLYCKGATEHPFAGPYVLRLGLGTCTMVLLVVPEPRLPSRSFVVQEFVPAVLGDTSLALVANDLDVIQVNAKQHLELCAASAGPLRGEPGAGADERTQARIAGETLLMMTLSSLLLLANGGIIRLEMATLQ